MRKGLEILRKIWLVIPMGISTSKITGTQRLQPKIQILSASAIYRKTELDKILSSQSDCFRTNKIISL